jgi:hypothetical protein
MFRGRQPPLIEFQYKLDPEPSSAFYGSTL